MKTNESPYKRIHFHKHQVSYDGIPRSTSIYAYDVVVGCIVIIPGFDEEPDSPVFVPGVKLEQVDETEWKLVPR